MTSSTLYAIINIEREVKPMKKNYQVTLFCTTGQYRPVSCIVTKDTEELEKLGKLEFVKQLKMKGIEKICNKRRWTGKELKTYHYTNIKIRECGNPA